MSFYSELIEIFNLTDSGLELVYGNYTTVPQYKQVNNSMGETIQKDSKNTGKCHDISVTDDYIYILCQPRRGKYLRTNDVLVFDWNGNPIMHYRLDEDVYSIFVTKDSKKLYALIRNEIPEIIYYNLNQ